MNTKPDNHPDAELLALEAKLVDEYPAIAPRGGCELVCGVPSP